MRETRPSLGGAGMIGALLGNYRIVHELQTGGMGTVFRARHELLGRPAAVKLLRPEFTANDELVQRFWNEAKAATAIDHPGIVEVFDFGHTDDGHAYIVMELLDGESLAQRVAARGRLAERDTALIARAIASALSAAHDKGIIHRDLKPDNVVLVRDPDVPGGERPKVLDFGIAKLAEPAGGASTSASHTATGALMGTPLYMAPEQARAASDIDGRADLYSLGCMMYEMLVGQPPFVATGAGEIIALQLFGKPEAPSKRLASIEPELERIVLRLLEKEPADRYASAAELVEVLGDVLDELDDGVAPAATGGGRRVPKLVTQRGRRETRRATDDRIPTEAPPEEPAERSAWPFVLAGLAIASVAVAAFVAIRHARDDGPTATKPPPVAAPAPAAAPAPTPTPPPSSPAVATPAPPTPPPAHPPTRPPPHTAGAHTSNGSPIETNLEGP